MKFALPVSDITAKNTCEQMFAFFCTNLIDCAILERKPKKKITPICSHNEGLAINKSPKDTGKEKDTTMASDKQDDIFYEIEYDSAPIPGIGNVPGVGKFVLKSQKFVKPESIKPERDEIMDTIYRMRDIARDYMAPLYASSKFFDRRVQRENARLLYKQGIFMQNFEDDYDQRVPYSSYFPNYQSMSYGQLRSYFTWRTAVRKGEIRETSLSYAYLYIYELLNHIGVEDSIEGVEEILSFWDVYREYDATLDRYVPRWLKDYYIYYDLPGTFHEFAGDYGLRDYYAEDYFSELSEAERQFDLYCEVSKYHIRDSKFMTPEKETLVRDSVLAALHAVISVLREHGLSFEDMVFCPGGKLKAWEPFKGALFYDWKNQRDRRVILSPKEIYICKDNHFSFSETPAADVGKRLVGYVMKRTEVVLRRLTGYKQKLSAEPDAVNAERLSVLKERGVSLERVIEEAVTAAYREATKTVVRVDALALARIREEALLTQERLTVEEEFLPREHLTAKPEGDICSGKLQPPCEAPPVLQTDSDQAGYMGAAVSEQETAEMIPAIPASPWHALRLALTPVELEALTLLSCGEKNLRPFADSHRVMLEVLIDSINEKAFDYIGDSLTDEAFSIYEDYLEDIRGLL